jgi:hypothetical protein
MDAGQDRLEVEVPLLLEAIDDGVVLIRFNVAELNTPGRPTHSYRDNWLVLGSPVVAGLLFLPIAWWLAIGFFLTGLIYAARLGQPWIFGRAMRRAMQLMQSDHRFFDEFWRDGMFMLVHLPTGDECPAREGDVRGFIRSHLTPAPPAPEA